MIDEDFGGLFQRILGTDGTIGCNLKDEFIVVGLLLNAERLNSVLDITDWGVNRVDWEYVYIKAVLTILLSLDIATAFVDRQVNLH